MFVWVGPSLPGSVEYGCIGGGCAAAYSRAGRCLHKVPFACCMMGERGGQPREVVKRWRPAYPHAAQERTGFAFNTIKSTPGETERSTARLHCSDTIKSTPGETERYTARLHCSNTIKSTPGETDRQIDCQVALLQHKLLVILSRCGVGTVWVYF